MKQAFQFDNLHNHVRADKNINSLQETLSQLFQIYILKLREVQIRQFNLTHIV